MEGAWAGRGPGWWDGDRLVTLCWAHLMRSDSGPAGRVVRASGRNGRQVVTVEAGGADTRAGGSGSCMPERFCELTRMARS